MTTDADYNARIDREEAETYAAYEKEAFDRGLLTARDLFDREACSIAVELLIDEVTESWLRNTHEYNNDCSRENCLDCLPF